MTRFFQSMEIGDRKFGWLIAISFILFLVHRPALNLWDDMTTAQPWFDVALEVERTDNGLWLVKYTRVINRPVRGVWTARVFETRPKKELVCTGGGYAVYSPYTSGTITMTLDDFVDDDGPCKLGEGEFELCSNYDLRNSGDRRRAFGPFCTKFSN